MAKGEGREWDEYLAGRQGHLLQSWAWGELKSRFGWTALRLRVNGAVAQLLFRRLPFGLTIAYIPKGPLVDWTDPDQGQALWTTIHAEAKKRRAIFLKVEPNLWNSTYPADSSPAVAAVTFLNEAGFILADTIQPRTSLIINLQNDNDAILAAMKQKTRYNIRLAEKRGVRIRQGQTADVATFYELAHITAARDGFGVHSLNYYQAAYELFAPERCVLLLAEFEGEPLAALMAFSYGQEAYYFYGASANQHRQLMATYLIQWAAIQWAKQQGCRHYDLWGIPDADPTTLEAEFEQRRERLWGVYRFKRGFGGQFVQSIGAYDYVYQPLLYQIYKLRRKAGQGGQL